MIFCPYLTVYLLDHGGSCGLSAARKADGQKTCDEKHMPMGVELREDPATGLFNELI